MQFWRIKNTNVELIDEKEYDNLQIKREIYVPNVWDELFLKDIDYADSANLYREIQDEILEGERWNKLATLLKILSYILVFAVWVGLWWALFSNKNNNNQQSMLLANQQPQNQQQVGNLSTSTEPKNIEEEAKKMIAEQEKRAAEQKKEQERINEIEEYKDKLNMCEKEVIRLDALNSVKACPACEQCEDTQPIKNKLQECENNYSKLFSDEYQFIQYLWKKVYDNCEKNESEECVNLYFNYKKELWKAK